MGGGPQDTYCDAFEAGASSRQAEVDELRRILDAWRGSCRLAEQRVLAAQAPAAAAQTRIETLERLLREGAALMPETDRRDQPHLERRSWCARALGALPR